MSIVLSLLATAVWLVITTMLTFAVQDFQNALNFQVLKEVNINICAAYSCIEGKGPDTGKLWGVVIIGFIAAGICLINSILLVLFKKKNHKKTKIPFGVHNHSKKNNEYIIVR